MTDGSGGRFSGFGRGMIIDHNDGVFIAIDADDDGQITKEEYLAVRRAPQWGWNQRRQSAMQARREARFAEKDPDKDGYVSPGEHRRDRWF